MAYTFDVALSYTSTEFELASRLETGLRARGFRVFFDRNQAEAIVGQDGKDALMTLYQRRARVCVLLLSPTFEQSSWTQLERDAVMTRRQTDRDAFLIPVLVAGEPPAWLPRQLLYFDLQRESARVDGRSRLASMIEWAKYSSQVNRLLVRGKIRDGKRKDERR